ncbi:MAG: hypothetical protein JW715_02185 [Sedimentisphaerales bacterium]|nr:hypothetical protein [Sedimentisphaerales bacterium]
MKKLIILCAFAAAGFCLTAVGQGLQNGTFDSDLSGWTTEPVDTDAVLWYGQAAVLLNPVDFPIGSNWPFPNSFAFLTSYPNPDGGDVVESRLSQEFSMPANPDKLSFDITTEVYNWTKYEPETDTLTAVLLHGAGLTQSETIFSITSTEVENQSVPGNLLLNEYVDEHWVNDDLVIGVLHVIFHTPVEYDVSSFAGQDVKLQFALSHDDEDEVFTTVTVDNVVISLTEDEDNTPPEVVVGGMSELWPPNHKYHTFNLSDLVLSVVDDRDGELDIDGSCVILSIYSDEPEDAKGNGDGSTVDDIVILGPSSFEVRSERQGGGNGRVYGVTFEVVDSSGNSTVMTVYLGVPKDQSGKKPVVDDGVAAGYIVYNL